MTALNIAIAVSNVGCALIGILLSRPLVRGKVSMNHFYGVRFKRSFESDEIWYEINRYGGQRMILWSYPILGLGLVALVTPPALTLILAFAPMLYLIPCIESYRHLRSL